MTATTYADMKVTELAKLARERGIVFTSRTKKVDLITMLETYDSVNVEDEGQTTDTLAAIFGTNAKALRVTLRQLGLGVGRGRRYHLTPSQVNIVRDALAS
jgi:hypothetical protein